MYKTLCENFFASAGITLNGSKDHDIKVNDKRFYKAVITRGSVGIGEAYMKGWWDCRNVDLFIAKAFSHNLDQQLRLPLPYMLHTAMNILQNPIIKSKKDIMKHYDIDEKLFRSMLDKNLVYSCGYWKNAKNLDQSQIDKLDMSCKKLELKKGMKVLDIGCGFGSFAKYAAQKYKVEITGITISPTHARIAEKQCKDFPVKIVQEDYRNHTGEYDAIVSLGMFEHVGLHNYLVFFNKVSHLMKKDSLFLLETIGSGLSLKRLEPWLEKYIFPGGFLPSARQIMDAAGLLNIEDWHNFGQDYDKTLMAWQANFQKIAGNYPEEFQRMWNFYLLSCAGATRCHRYHNYQIVFSKMSTERGYSR